MKAGKWEVPLPKVQTISRMCYAGCLLTYFVDTSSPTGAAGGRGRDVQGDAVGQAAEEAVEADGHQGHLCGAQLHAQAAQI